MKTEEAVQKRLFKSYIREEAYKYLRSKDFQRRAGITKKRPYLLIQPLLLSIEMEFGFLQ